MAAHVSRTLIASFESGNQVSHNNHLAITLALSAGRGDEGHGPRRRAQGGLLYGNVVH